MKYKCVDHIEKFWFRDAQLEKIVCSPDELELIAAGIVARYNNPANETLVDRYMDTASVRFKNAKISRVYLEGAKYYSADDTLLKEIPDTDLSEEEYPAIFKQCKGALLYTLSAKPTDGDEGKCCEFAVDIEDPEDEDAISTYWVVLTYEKSVVEWDRFLNKAMLEV